MRVESFSSKIWSLFELAETVTLFFKAESMVLLCAAFSALLAGVLYYCLDMEGKAVVKSYLC